MTYHRKAAELIRPGDVILPPERELRLWMRRENTSKGLPETALHLTVTAVEEGAPDKNGRWLWIKAQYSPEWNGRPFGTIKARPHTLWPCHAE